MISRIAAGGAAMTLYLAAVPAVAQATQSATIGGENQLPPKTVVTGDDDAAPGSKSTQGGAKTKSASRGATGGGAQAIVALVNDEPITGYEIQQRAIMLGGGNIQKQAQANFQAIIKNPKTTERLKAILNETIKANEGKSRDEIIAIFERRKKEFGISLQKQAVESARATAAPGAKKAALEELIDERLKLQEAKRQNVTIDDAEVDRVLAGIAERNKMTLAQFIQQIGGNADAMKQRIRSSLAFNEVVRRRYGAQITVTSRDVDRMIASGASSGGEETELRIQRIRIAIPAKVEKNSISTRIQEAEAIRAKFSGCAAMSKIAAGVAGAQFEDLGTRRASTIPEPTRSMLLSASDGEILPPTVGEGNVELWAMCGRNVVAAEMQQRDQAEGELKQKQFELMAKRHLRDLRQDAHIEYR